MPEILAEHLARGVLYIGSSAGTVVSCPDIAFIESMDDASAANLNDTSGMGLIDFSIMPHMDHPDYGAIARELAARAGRDHHMIGLRDDQALLVRGLYAEVF